MNLHRNAVCVTLYLIVNDNGRSTPSALHHTKTLAFLLLTLPSFSFTHLHSRLVPLPFWTHDLGTGMSSFIDATLGALLLGGFCAAV